MAANRPSGQGHSLVAAVVTEKCTAHGAHSCISCARLTRRIPVSPELVSELDRLPQRNQRFFPSLLNDITQLTHQFGAALSRHFCPSPSILPPCQRLETRLHLRRDPARILWQHNDRYEHKMFETPAAAAHHAGIFTAV